MKLHYAEVIDNNDLTMKGRVKIKIHHKHDDMTDDMLPWATQFHLEIGGMTLADSSTPYGSLKIPPIGSLIWVFFADEKNDKTPFYMSGVSLDIMTVSHNAKVTGAIQAIINTMTAIPPPAISVVYPNLHYTLYPNGLVLGVSSDKVNSDCFVMNTNAGSFISMNTSGSIHAKGTSITLQGTTGAIIPDPASKGGFCALPFCLFTGTPHKGDTIT